VFYFRNYPAVLDEVETTELLTAFLTGFRFDASVVSYSLILVLSLYIIVFIIKIFYDISNKIYIGLIILHNSLLFIILLIQVIDIEYFRTFGFHISFRDFQYLDSPEVYGTAASDYPLTAYMLFLVSAIIMFVFFLIKLKKLLIFERTAANIISGLINIVILAGLLIIGARGGISISNLNWGSSVFSDNDILNQSALNGVFTIGKSYDLYKKSKNLKTVDLAKNANINEEILKSLILKGEKYEKVNSKNAFRRITFTNAERRDLNVVLILLEGWMFEYVNKEIENREITPFFNGLSEKGIFFTNCYSTGTRSNKGIESVICSVPCQYGISALKRIEGRKSFFSIPAILKGRNYYNSFIYGGDPEFDNMKGFLKINGIDNFIGNKDIKAEEISSKWGSFDEDTFRKALNEMDNFPKPFFTLIFTLSSHEPFDLPDSFERKFSGSAERGEYINSLAYSDNSLKVFFEEFSGKPYFSDTVFLLLSDHGRNRHKNIPMDREKFHIPFLIYSENPAVKDKAGKISKLCSQTDVLPVLMGILGGEYENASWGKDILNTTEAGYAYLTDGDRVGIIINDTLTTQSPGREVLYYNKNDSLIQPGINNSGLKFKKDFLANILYFSTEYLNLQIHGK